MKKGVVIALVLLLLLLFTSVVMAHDYDLSGYTYRPTDTAIDNFIASNSHRNIYLLSYEVYNSDGSFVFEMLASNSNIDMFMESGSFKQINMTNTESVDRLRTDSTVVVIQPSTKYQLATINNSGVWWIGDWDDEGSPGYISEPISVKKPLLEETTLPTVLEFTLNKKIWEEKAGLNKGIQIMQIGSDNVERFVQYIHTSMLIDQFTYSYDIANIEPGTTKFLFYETEENGSIIANEYKQEYSFAYNPVGGIDASFKAQVVRSWTNKPLARLASSIVDVKNKKLVPGDFAITVNYTRTDLTQVSAVGTYKYPDNFYTDVGVLTYSSVEKVGYRYYELFLQDLSLDANNNTTNETVVNWSFTAKNINLVINGVIRIPAGVSVKHVLNDLFNPSDWYLQDTATPIAEGTTGQVTVPGEGTPGQNTGTEQNPYPVDDNIATSIGKFLTGLLAVIGAVIRLGLRILQMVTSLYNVPSTSSLLDSNFIDGFTLLRSFKLGHIHIWNTISSVLTFGYTLIIFKTARRYF